MAKLTIEEIIAAVKELTVLELNDLVKAAEEEFGVSAAAGVAVVAGPAAGAAVLNKVAKNVKELEFKAGVVEGVVYDAAGMKLIADIPSREVLLSKLLGSFKSPMSSFARVIDQIAKKDA